MSWKKWLGRETLGAGSDSEKTEPSLGLHDNRPKEILHKPLEKAKERVENKDLSLALARIKLADSVSQIRDIAERYNELQPDYNNAQDFSRELLHVEVEGKVVRIMADALQQDHVYLMVSVESKEKFIALLEQKDMLFDNVLSFRDLEQRVLRLRDAGFFDLAVDRHTYKLERILDLIAKVKNNLEKLRGLDNQALLSELMSYGITGSKISPQSRSSFRMTMFWLVKQSALREKR